MRDNLLQNAFADEQRVHLLPALPGAWREGSVRGLKAPGDVTVSLRWAEGRLVEARLESPIAQTVRVRWPGGEEEVCLQKGKAWTLSGGLSKACGIG